MLKGKSRQFRFRRFLLYVFAQTETVPGLRKNASRRIIGFAINGHAFKYETPWRSTNA